MPFVDENLDPAVRGRPKGDPLPGAGGNPRQDPVALPLLDPGDAARRRDFGLDGPAAGRAVSRTLRALARKEDR